MSKNWEQEYASRTLADVSLPAELLKSYCSLFTRGKALDIASGTGHNAVYLSTAGYEVTAIDKSAAAARLAQAYAAEKGEKIHTVTTDILSYPIEAESFDLIADFYFLERTIIPHIKSGLKPGGLVFFETYTLEQQDIDGPHNPDFLLKPNELLNWFKEFFIIFYHERIEGKKAIASLVAQKTAP